ncbi:MAG: hypothetical protein SCARUB_02806 [Candidatus Scalindua rubra]|uniref:Uncharacterized protein n=1 Tax=Candidatus Scalindua rubra TaxID=1872076 RepID=A0A1E3X936_9BACT|nr:MAG: hypothetical protein SCARUB_02806 [Candidatus Scalindua rubra]
MSGLINLEKKLKRLQKIKTIIKYLAESVADEDYLGDNEWADKLRKKLMRLMN